MSRFAFHAADRARALLVLALALLPVALAAQDSLASAEFASRRARLLEKIPDGIAVIMGGEEHPEVVRFRQSPDFYYLTGIEEPGAVLLLNGVSKSAVVFALKRPQFGTPDVRARLRDMEKPQESVGLKVHVQLTPPDRLLHARTEARIFDAQAMDHPLFGHPLRRDAGGRADPRNRVPPDACRREPDGGRASLGQVAI